MAIDSAAAVQTLQPVGPVNKPQPVSVPPDDRRETAEREAQRTEAETRRPPAGPGKGSFVDRDA